MFHASGVVAHLPGGGCRRFGVGGILLHDFIDCGYRMIYLVDPLGLFIGSRGDLTHQLTDLAGTFGNLIERIMGRERQFFPVSYFPLCPLFLNQF